MTKIKRVTQKVFGVNAPSDDIAVMGSFKSGTPVYTDDVAKLQNTAYEEGYSSSLIMNAAPFMEEQNSVPYVLSKQLAYTFQEGIPEYDENTTYYTNSICKVANKLYISKTDDNQGHNPVDDTTENWEELSLGNKGTGTGLSLFDLVEKDHILTFKESKGLAQLGTYAYKTGVADSRYGYPDFYNKCLAEKTASTATQTQLGDNTVTLYKNDNGHIFYDIADKDAIDAWYNTYGVAWYYGVDTANARIFLPRNDWFTQNGSTTEVGNFVEAGLPSIEHTHDVQMYNNTGATRHFPSQYDTSSKGNIYTTSTNSQVSSIYGKSTTVQPNAVKKLFYMCVGNTDVESAITDVVDITTSENDTIPLGWSTYQSGGTPSSAFVASLGQWNSGKLYSSFFNTYAAKIGQKFGTGAIKEAHTVYDPSKFTVVGNPTITDDGVASGFSTSNYLTIANINKSLNTFKIEGEFVTSDSVTTSQMIFTTAVTDSNLTIRSLALQQFTSGTLYCYIPRSSGENWIVGTTVLQANTKYYFKINFDGVNVTWAYGTDKNNLVAQPSANCLTSTLNNVIRIGVSSTGSSAFLGSIDLKSFSITVDGEEVFNGTKTVMPDDVTDYDLVINQDDQTFRLPLKNGQEGMFANGVKGNGMTLGFYSTSDNVGFGIARNTDSNVAYSLNAYNNVYGTPVDTTVTTGAPNKGKSFGITTDSSKSGMIVDKTVPDGFQLYYKVSNAVQNLELLDVAEVTTALANKIGRTECKSYVTETYVNGTSGYRLYSDGYCEQWGNNTPSTNNITFLKPFKDTSYNASKIFITDSSKTGMTFEQISINNKTTSGMKIGSAAVPIDWKVEGYVS